MGKSKSSNKVKVASTNALPIAPWIYINDPLNHTVIASALISLIPSVSFITDPTSAIDKTIQSITDPRYKDVVVLLATNFGETRAEVMQATANEYREAAIAHGCNFASINVCHTDTYKNESGWGANHLNMSANGLIAQEIAERIYKWLFGALTVHETLHLIPEKEMLAIDRASFPDYAYCPIVDSRKHPKNAKIQFVALITSKPTISAGKKLHWTVADRTGIANFYFQWRGPESQYTWDWVLKLQPGDRKALPRMPFIQVKEKKRVTVIKAPFRAVGSVVGGTGHVIRSVGQGLCKLGNKIKMGSRSEWIPEADVVVKDGKAVKAASVVAENGGKTEIKIFDEKGHKLWKDDDGDASTTAGSILDEKIGKEFC